MIAEGPMQTTGYPSDLTFDFGHEHVLALL